MTQFHCRLEIEPVAQARARIGPGYGYYPARSTEGRETLKWAVIEEIAQQSGFYNRETFTPQQPLSLSATFGRPVKDKKRWGLLKTTSPDLDNYIKMLCDGIQDSGLIEDDAAIVHLDCRKVYAEPPGFIEFTLKEVE
jgi:Holliday junction resolvase RusA-like endonuclease